MPILVDWVEAVAEEAVEVVAEEAEGAEVGVGRIQ